MSTTAQRIRANEPDAGVPGAAVVTDATGTRTVKLAGLCADARPGLSFLQAADRKRACRQPDGPLVGTRLARISPPMCA